MTELSQQDGFVFYQRPNDHEILFISGTWVKIDLNSKPTLDGFIVSNADKSASFYLEGKAKILLSEYKLSLDSSSLKRQELDKKTYLSKAELFINACTKDISKVVLSRIKKYPVINGDIFQTYLNLCKEYNHSFNYLFNIPNEGTWTGATPETLIEGSAEKYTTVALAGSKPLDNINWKEKELDEQQFVTNYIKEKLESESINHQFNSNPETVTAGNIAHLKTTFNIQTNKSPLELADLLHPTPAVCGLPQKKAQDFILKNEGYNREFYTGFLGIINNTSCSLFVNLRCMQLFKNENWLYVGGGITSESNPDNEWRETELKTQTLLNILD